MTQASTGAPDLGAIFKGAREDRVLSDAGAAVLNLPDFGAQIQAAFGVKVDDVQASDVIVLGMDVDDSTSIASAGNEAVVREGVNIITDALTATKQVNQIVARASLFNAGQLYAFTPIKRVVRITEQNYRAMGVTPLFDRMAVTLGAVMAKCQEFAQAGVPARGITVIVTDGANFGGKVYNQPEAVAPLVRDLLATEQHLVIGMGIDDGGQTDFVDIFTRAGLQRRWILTPKSTQSEIRAAFAMVSQSAVRASQSPAGAGFSQVAGGFGT